MVGGDHPASIERVETPAADVRVLVSGVSTTLAGARCSTNGVRRSLRSLLDHRTLAVGRAANGAQRLSVSIPPQPTYECWFPGSRRRSLALAARPTAYDARCARCSTTGPSPSVEQRTARSA